MSKILHLTVGFILFFNCGLLTAATLNNANELDTGHTRINFNELPSDIVVSKQYESLGVVISGSQGLHGKGAPVDVFSSPLFDLMAIGTRGSHLDSSVVFDFSTPVTQFATFIIDPQPGTFAVYDESNNLIESLPLTENVIEGFAGIDTGNRLISRAIVSGNRFSFNEILYNTAGVSSGLEVEISVTSDWGEGYCVDLLISNTSSKILLDWSINVDTNASTLSESRWNANFSDVSGSVTISGLSWNSAIEAGKTENTVGFCAYRDDPNSTALPLIE